MATFTARIFGADPELWRELRVEATRRNVPTARLWNEIVRDWLERRAASHAQQAKEVATAAKS